MPLAAIAVLLLSGLAFVVAAGGLGVAEAARARPSAAGGTPSPSTLGPSPSNVAPSETIPPGPGSAPSGAAEPSFAPVP
jgi:hypothetical protein